MTPGWPSSVSAAHDDRLNPPDDVELTEQEIEDADDYAAEKAYDALKDSGAV